jgi:hypothetical protein
MNKYDINSILHIFHDGKGHVGMEKTYTAIAELYYWNNIHESIEDYYCFIVTFNQPVCMLVVRG